MIKSLAATTLVAAAFLSSTAMAGVRIVDFESYVVGQPFASHDIGDIDPGIDLINAGSATVISNDDAPGIGKHLELLEPLHLDYVQIRFYSPRLTETLRYTPTLVSFDIYSSAPTRLYRDDIGYSDFYSPGVWQTIEVDDLIFGASTYKFFGEGVRLDNFVFEDGETYLPEPSTWVMLIGGFGLAGARLRRSRELHRTHR